MGDAADELQQFHDQRASGIGATDSPKILGLSRWGTGLTVYEDKLRIREPSPPSLPAWLGKKMQATVGELYTAATGNRVRAVSDLQQFRHKEHDWMVCHLDFRVWGNPKLLVEAKTRAYDDGFGEDGSTIVPAEEWVQCQHEMAVTGATLTHLAVLFGHRRFAVYPIARNDRFIEGLIEKLEQFWFGNVQLGIPPVPTGHDADTEAVKLRHPDHDDTMLQASAEQEPLFRDLATVRANELQVAQRRAELENRIKEVIGSAAGIQGAFGEVTWKLSKEGVAVRWDALAAAYRSALERVAGIEKVLSDGFGTTRFEDIELLHTDVVPGSRRFLFKPVKEKQ